MKTRYLFCLAFMACVPRYTLELHAESTPPTLPQIGPPIVMSEGNALNTRIALRRDEELIRDLEEDDLVVTSSDTTIVNAWPGPKSLNLVLLGVAPGDATLQVRYKGKIVSHVQVQVTAQAR